MPRKREGFIQESVEQLLQLEEEYRGRPEGARIRALLILRQEAARPLEEVAGLVGFSSSAIKRWIRAYRQGGLEAVLNLQGGGRDDVAVNAGLAKLKQKLLSGEFQNLHEVHAWTEDYRHSLGMQSLAQQAVHGSGGGRVARSFNGASSTEAVAGDEWRHIAERILEFIANLPPTSSVREFVTAIREFLLDAFADLDYVTVTANAYCDLRGERGGAVIAHMHGIATGEMAVSAMQASEYADESAHIERVLAMVTLPIAEYRQPKAYVYYLNGTAYLGSIILWRKRGRPPISRATLATFDRLRPVWTFMLSDFVARHQAMFPEQTSIQNMIDHVVTQRTELTEQERRILSLQLYGNSYQEIARILNVSENTVRTHVRSIYTKSGAHSPIDFMVRYFSPGAAGVVQDGLEQQEEGMSTDD